MSSNRTSEVRPRFGAIPPDSCFIDTTTGLVNVWDGSEWKIDSDPLARLRVLAKDLRGYHHPNRQRRMWCNVCDKLWPCSTELIIRHHLQEPTWQDGEVRHGWE